MASRIAQETNRAAKGKTGALTKNRRKKRGMKAKPYGKGVIPPGTPVPKGYTEKSSIRKKKK